MERDTSLGMDEVKHDPLLRGNTVREAISRMMAERIREGKDTHRVNMSPTFLDWLLTELDGSTRTRPFEVVSMGSGWHIVFGAMGRKVACYADESITNDLYRWVNGP